VKPLGSLMHAESIGRHFSADADLVPPDRPRILPEVLVLPFDEDGLLFVGTKESQLIRGNSARDLLPRLLPHLNGRSTIEELTSRLPQVAPGTIRNAVTLLYSRGLLEDGCPPPVAADLQNLDSFLGRFVDVTRVNRNRGEALNRLQASSVLVGGSEEAADLMQRQLAGSGIGRLGLVKDSEPNLQGCSLLLAVATREADDLTSLLEQAAQQRVWALHVRAAREVVQIGPLFMPDQVCCYRCMREIHDRPCGDAEPDLRSFWLGMAALEAFLVLSRLGNPRLHNGFELYERTRHGIVHQYRYVVGMPGCSRCGLGGPPLDPKSPAFLSWLLHSSVSMPPHALRSPREHQNHYNASNIALTLALNEPYYGAPEVALPTARPLNGPLPWSQEGPQRPGIDVEELATLLWYAAGYHKIDGGAHWRIAPTAGGLGSPELFVIARQVDGVPEGIYRYHSPRHVLESLKPSSLPLMQAALGIATALPPCTIVGTGALGKVRSKYQNFSYRLVNLDAGVALGYLHDVASALGLRVREYSNIHDKAIAEAIGLPIAENRYVPTFAIGLGGDDAHTEEIFAALGPQVLNAVIGAAAPPLSRRRLPSNRQENGFVLPQHRETEPTMSTLGSVLLARRSVRAYAPRPIAPRLLQRLTALAIDISRKRIGSGGAMVNVRPWLALRVPCGALDAGIYQIDVERPDELVLRVSGFSQDDMERCLVQKSLSVAPAMFFITGDFGAALAERGPRAYRELLLQAGAAVSRSLLVATAHGLGACASAGLMEASVRSLANIDGYRDCPLVALTAGYPSES
jgi:SagB-type dehydrogenase family enzyme